MADDPEAVQMWQVWDRAAMHQHGDTYPGDMALTDLLWVHGMVMSGGIGHAVDVLSESDVNSGIDGFRYFGLTPVSDLLEEVMALVRADTWEDTDDGSFDARYNELVPRNAVLMDHFEAHYRAAPRDFQPIQQPS